MKLPSIVLVCVVLSGCSSSATEEKPAADDSAENLNDVPSEQAPLADNIEPVDAPEAIDAIQLVNQAFEILSGKAYDRRLTVFPYTKTVNKPVSYGVDLSIQRLSTRDCENAGQVSSNEEYDDFSYRVESVFSACLIGDDTLAGQVVLEENHDNFPLQRDFKDQFTISFEPMGTMRVSGKYSQINSNSSRRVFAVNNFDYDFNYPGGTLTVTDANTIRSFRVDGEQDNDGLIAYIKGSFNMIAPAGAGQEFTVEVQEPFFNLQTPTQIQYESGILKISNDQASFLLEADNGNADTVRITTQIEGNSPSTMDVPWSAWLDALAYSPPEPSTQLVSIPDNTQTDIIRSDNYASILSDVFSVVSGERIVPDILKLPGYPLPDFPLPLAPNTEDGLGSAFTQSCDNGGSVEFRPYKFGARQLISGWNMAFDECQHAEANLVGTFFTRDFGNFIYGSIDGLTVINPQQRTQHMRGELNYKHGPDRDGGPAVWFRFNGNYSDSASIANTEDGTEQFNVSDASFLSAATTARHNINTLASGHFVLSSPSTGYNELNVLFANPFGQDYQMAVFDSSENYYSWGTLVVSALNGNRMIVTVDNDERETFDVVIESPGSEPYKTKEQWSNWHSKLEFKTDLHIQ